MRKPADLETRSRRFRMEKGRLRNSKRRRLARWCPRTVRASSPRHAWPATCSPPSNKSAKNPKPSRGGPNAAPRTFVGRQERVSGESATGPVCLLRNRPTLARLPGQAAVRPNRLDAQRGRTATRECFKAAPERSHYFFPRGGFVRTTGVAAPLRDDPHHGITRWRRRCVRAFDADREPLSPEGQVRRQEGIR